MQYLCVCVCVHITFPISMDFNASEIICRLKSQEPNDFTHLMRNKESKRKLRISLFHKIICQQF